MNSTPKVSLVVYSLDANPIVRATPIAHALCRLGFDVEVTGVLGPDQAIYQPYAKTFDYITAPTIRELAKRISGDIIYACKPFPETLLTAMIASDWGRQKPVVLDAEDDDYGVVGRNPVVRCARAARDFAFRPSGYLYALTNRLRTRCDAVTVSTSALQNYFGGIKLLHGPNESDFDPSRSELDQAECRSHFGLPRNELFVLFAGRPWKHKGIGEIIEATAIAGCGLALAGNPDEPLFQQAKARLGDKCHLIGMVPNDRMPHLLAAIDIVTVPQHDIPFARTQLPAKLIEAMAMGKSVVVSDVGDLKSIVQGNDQHPNESQRRGWVIRPESVEDLIAAIREIQQFPEVAAERGNRAREFFEDHASVTANAYLLRELFLATPRLRALMPPDVDTDSGHDYMNRVAS